MLAATSRRPSSLKIYGTRGILATHIAHALYSKLENVAIANALQLEAARRRAGPIPFKTSPVASLKSPSLSVAVLERIYCLYVTLRCDLEL